MLFLKIMFWASVVGIVFRVIFCCMEHPRKISPNNLGVDVVVLIEQIALAVFFWGYTFGGWIIR